MKKVVFISLIACLFWGKVFSLKAQSLENFTLPTPWTEDALQAEIPLSEYPRPQMVRTEWMNLNGIWSYMGGKTLPSPMDAVTPPVFFFQGRKDSYPVSAGSGIVGNCPQGRLHFVVQPEFHYS